MSAKSRPALKPVVAALGRHYGWTTLALLPGLALAGPSGEQVQQGAVTVARPDGATTTVTQGSTNAVVNWHSFSVDGQEYVQFVQPGANAAILNRVVGGNASQILGRIDANGRVFLVNPQGVYFGAGAQVDTAGFAASALDINDDDFMNGRYVFTKGSGAADASIENHGEINADQFVVLMGDRVANEGLVQARLGTVALAAGEQVTMQLDSSGLISFAVDEATAAAHAGVENTGEIIANGGRVLMTAKVADGLVATAVNNEGVVRATGIAEADGQIFLRASGGNVVNSGTLDASGPNGGRIVVQSSEDVEIKAGAVVTAAGQGSGDGGTVKLVGSQSLDVDAGALVDVRGGADGGAGGIIELSAHEGVLSVEGDIEAGAGGEVIIDPARLGIGAGAAVPGGNSTLSTVGKGFIEGKLNAGTDVTLVAGDEIFSSGGPFTIAASGAGNLTLRIGGMSGPTGSGSFDGGGSYGGDCGSLGLCSDVGVPNGDFNFTTDSGGDINLTGISINIAGAFQASAGSASGNVNLGAIAAAAVTINGLNTSLATGNVVTGAILAPTGLVTIDAGATTGNVTTGNITGRTISINNTGATLATGNVNLGTLLARDVVTVKAGSTSGNLNLGGVTMSTTGHNVEVLLAAQNGNVNVTGPVSLTATPSAASADVEIEGRVVNVNGAITATAGASGSASIDIVASNGININGNLVSVGGGDSAGIFLRNNSTGNININGNVTATGGSSGSIDIDNNGGNINIAGNLTAVGSSASIFVEAQQRLTINGNVAAVANASYGSASIDLIARSGVSVTGSVVASADEEANISVFNGPYGGGSGDISILGAMVAQSAQSDASIQVFNGHGNVTLAGLVRATGAGLNSSRIRVGASDGFITTLNTGLLEAQRVQLSVSAATAVAVRTSSPRISFSHYGSGSPDVAVDNTAFAGDTVIQTSTFIFGGSYGSSGRGGPSAAFSVGGGFGATRIRAAGNLEFQGDFAARNALIDVTNGTLKFRGDVLIGERNLPGTEGDVISLLALSRAVRPDGTGIPLPRFNGALTAGPNAVFKARTGIGFDSGLGFVDPDTPYVVFQTDGLLDLGPGVFSESSIGNEFLAQFAAYTPTNRIYVEDKMPLVRALDGPTFTNEDHFSKLPGTTMIIGGSRLPTGIQSGEILIGQGGSLDIGGQNILFLSRGLITGADQVLSTGFVGSLRLSANGIPILTESSGFGDCRTGEKECQPTLVIEEILTATEEKKELLPPGLDEEGGDDSSELLAQKSNNGQMCQ